MDTVTTIITTESIQKRVCQKAQRKNLNLCNQQENRFLQIKQAFKL